MKTAWALGAGLLVAGSLLGQSVAPRHTFGSPSGFGNILFPGVGTAPPIRIGGTSSFAHRLGATVGGAPVFTGARPGGRIGRGGFGGGAVAIPYAVPVYVGGYGYDSPYPYPQQPPMIVMAPPQPQQPQVVINQYYVPETAKPVMREYPQSSAESETELKTYAAPTTQPYPEPKEQKASFFLIAFKDGSIYPTMAYWVEGNTLHYITKEGAHNRATLDRVDAEFSEQLNRERGVDFRLPLPR